MNLMAPMNTSVLERRFFKKGIRASNNGIKGLIRENNLVSALKTKFKATTNSNHNHSVTPSY